MEDSGYGAPIREEVICSGVKIYWRRRLNEMAGIRDLYRSREEMDQQGRYKQMSTRVWFKSRKGGSRKSALMDSGLAEEWQEIGFMEGNDAQKWRTGQERRTAATIQDSKTQKRLCLFMLLT